MYFALRHFPERDMRLLAEIGPITVAGMGWLLAQINGLDPSVANLIGNGVTIAVLAWYVVYDVRVRMPSLLSTFTKEQDELRRAFKDEQAGSRETFKKEQSEQRHGFTVILDSLLKDGKEDRAKMREAHAVEIGEWRRMVNEHLQGFRTAVHDVRDTAAAVVGQAELIVKGTK